MLHIAVIIFRKAQIKMKTKMIENKESVQPVIFLKGKRVRLRPIEKTDIDRCTIWINDPEVRDFVSNSFPISHTQEEEYVGETKIPQNHIKLAIETNSGIHIGNISVFHINWIDRTAETGALIGNKKYWSKGYGTEAKMLLMDYAFNTLGLRKLHSAAYTYNERSINYSLKCGYKIIGRKKEEKLRNGVYHDLVMLEVFRDEWQTAHDVWSKNQSKSVTKKGVKK